MKKSQNSISLYNFLFITLLSFSNCVYAQGIKPVPKTNKQIVISGMKEYSNKVSAIYFELGNSSRGNGLVPKLQRLDREVLLPLGTPALPFLVPAAQSSRDFGGGVYIIGKFIPHNIELKREPGNSQSTTEEFPELIEKDVVWDARKQFLKWWLEGKERTPVWFADRYPKWIELKEQGKEADAKAMYQKLLDIGLPAIPLWLEKLQANPDAATKQAIGDALSYLTDGDVKAGLTATEYSDWWKLNQKKWTIPFPQSKLSYVAWLEKEANLDDGLAVPCVVTLSRVEEKAGIDALIRLVYHPSLEVRTQSLEQLQKLLGEQLSEEYRLGIGTDEWENLSDLQDLNKYETARKALGEWKSKMSDKAIAEKTALDLTTWWKANGEKAVIYWPRAWENL